jgi:ferrous iron transport protein B
MLAVLNFWDDTKHTGISIDKEKMENILGIPCVPTCAVSGEGIKILVERLQDARVSLFDYDEKEKWNKIGEGIEKVQQVFHRHHTILDRFSEYSVKPFSGILIALTVAFFLLK